MVHSCSHFWCIPNYHFWCIFSYRLQQDFPKEQNGYSIPSKAKDPFKLLIAEDNAVNRMLIKIYMEKLDPNAIILEAENGEEALELLKSSSKPNLVITDINMPKLDGYELLKAIRSKPSTIQIPVIGFTANAFQSEEEEIKNAGFDGFLTKPVVQEKFKEVVMKWLKNNN